MRKQSRPVALLRRAVVYEVGMWRSLFRWLLRRPLVLPPGAEAFSYIGVVKPILVTFIVLSAIEIPIFDLIIRHTVPWPSVRDAALGLGIWGLLWMIGLFASLRIHPHVADAAGLRVRNGFSVDFMVPWAAVARVEARYRSLPSSRTVQLELDDAGAVLNVGTGKQTSVDVVLREPLSVRLPKGPSEPVREIRLYADDPAALVALTRRHLAVRLPGSDV
ncbi:PH domain-containing protein [Micromonospora rhizosphaerae]|uniref:PH domain-containing protein n=1 Tax=Micromonospora rhizosphaerae TaxID=568872 RepID=UPI001FDEE10B|nr:PH domain-containing protein [Micromonospora rhizosphaerae]